MYFHTSSVSSLKFGSADVSKVCMGSTQIWPISSGDPHWANVQLLINFDGADTSTDFVDITGNHTITRGTSVNNQAQLSTARKKYGTASLLLDGGDDCVRYLPNSTIGTADFTLEMWVYNDRASGAIFYSCLYDFDYSYSFECQNGTLTFYEDAPVYDYILSHQTLLTEQTWHFVVLERSAGVLRIYLNGVPSSSTASLTANINQTGYHYIGAYQNNGMEWKGNIDEVRLTVGVARYNGSTFTPPTQPFPDY